MDMKTMKNALEDHEGTVSIGGRTITNLRFADDIDGLDGQEQELVRLVNHLGGLHSIWHADQSREDPVDDK